MVALAFIGILTGVVGSVAGLVGCVLGIEPSVSAITLVAIGTSLPDTFASMTAARTSEHADSAVGNVTGSNSVNVFLGLGLPWVIASIYNRKEMN
jgi:solute carrier family 8 (sodium/calcium exchanger)